MAWEPQCTPPPRRGLGRHLVGCWGRPLPRMSRPWASWRGCPGPQGGAAGGGPAGAAAHPALPTSRSPRPGRAGGNVEQAGKRHWKPRGRVCVGGWRRPHLRLILPPSPPLLPLCRAQSPGSQGDARRTLYLESVRSTWATAAKPQVRVGRRVVTRSPGMVDRRAGQPIGCVVTVPSATGFFHQALLPPAPHNLVRTPQPTSPQAS